MNHIFLTGEKQIGKSTIINKVIDECRRKDLKVSGIKSVSILKGNVRNVYLMPALDYIPDENNCKKAGVCVNHHITERNTHVFDNYGVELLSKIDKDTDVIIIDEIGKMEKEAKKYCAKIFEILNQNKIQVIGVIQNMARGDLADYIRTSKKIELVEITKDNRDAVWDTIKNII